MRRKINQLFKPLIIKVKWKVHMSKWLTYLLKESSQLPQSKEIVFSHLSGKRKPFKK